MLQRSLDRVHLVSAQTVREAAADYLDGCWHITVSGSLKTNEEIYDYLLQEGDEIICLRKVEGADPISMAVMLVVKAFVGYVVNMALNALFGGNKAPKPSHGGGGESDSPTYGWDGIRSSSDVGIPVPLIYGKHAVGGNYVNAFIEEHDNKAHNYRSYLNLLIALGEGPVKSIAGIDRDVDGWDDETSYQTGDYCTDSGRVWRAVQDNTDVDPGEEDQNPDESYWEEIYDYRDKIKLDNNPIGNFRDIKVFTRLGNESQAAVPGFEQQHNLVPIEGVQLEKNDPYQYTTDATDIDQYKIHFVAQSCVKFDKSSNGMAPHTIKVKVEHRKHDAGEDWQQAATKTVTRETMNEVRFYIQVRNLTPAQYDIRITQTSDNTKDGKRSCDLNITNIDEIRSVTLTHPYTALLGIRALATNKLSGTLGDVSVEVEGLLVDTWEAEAVDPTHQYSKNPIWCLRDLMTNKRYGIGSYIESADLYLPSDKEQAAYCDEQITHSGKTEARYELDIVIDSDKAAIDTMMDIARTCRAMLTWSGGVIRIIIEKPETPAKLFCMGNIIQGSFKEDFISNSETFNIVEVQFKNPDKNYDREVIQVEDSAALAAGDPIRKKTVYMLGVVRESQAVRMGRFILNHSKRVIRSVEFKTGCDSVGVTAGDVFNFQHDVPQWGVSGGRITAAGGVFVGDPDLLTLPWVKLSMAATFETGQTYYLKVRHADDTVEQHVIANAAGTYAAGEKIYVYDTELDKHGYILYVSHWTAAPEVYDVYSVGKENILTKPFRMMQISREGNEAVCVAQEYDAAIYNDTVDFLPPPLDYADLPDPRRIPRHVENFRASVVPNLGDNTIYLNWTVNVTDASHGLFDYAVLYRSVDATNWDYLGIGQSGTYPVSGLITGVKHYFKAVAVSRWAVRADDDTAPTCFITVGTVTGEKPPRIRGLELIGQGNEPTWRGRDACFVWKDCVSNTAIQPAGEETYGAGTGTRDAWIRGYKVQIFTPDLLGFPQLVRSEIVSDPAYTYTFDKNRQDHGSPARQMIITVRTVDIYNRESSPWTWLYVQNPPASPPTSFTQKIKKYVDGSSIEHIVGWEWSWAANAADLSDSMTYKLEVQRAVSGWETAYQGNSTTFQMGYNEMGEELVIGSRVSALDQFGTPWSAANASPTVWSYTIVGL